MRSLLVQLEPASAARAVRVREARGVVLAQASLASQAKPRVCGLSDWLRRASGRLGGEAKIFTVCRRFCPELLTRSDCLNMRASVNVKIT